MTNEHEREATTAAIRRLLAGTPLRSSGALDIVTLAEEAGVKRNTLTHKHTDLKDLRYRVFADDPSPGKLEMFFRMDAATVEHVETKPRRAAILSSASIRRSTGIERSTSPPRHSRVCSSTIDTILAERPTVVASSWKSTAHTRFGASAAGSGGAVEPPHVSTKSTCRWQVAGTAALASDQPRRRNLSAQPHPTSQAGHRVGSRPGRPTGGARTDTGPWLGWPDRSVGYSRSPTPCGARLTRCTAWTEPAGPRTARGNATRTRSPRAARCLGEGTRLP